MKVFKVIVEKDGNKKKKNGRLSTESVRSEYMYAADDIWTVYESTRARDETVIAIVEAQ